MVRKSPSPTYWAELKRTHLQNTHTHTHSHIHTPGAGRRRGCSRSRSSRREWLAARLQKCTSAPSLTKRTGYRSVFLGPLPLSPPSSSPLPPRGLLPPAPPPPPRLGAARERNLPLPPSPTPLRTPLSLSLPSSPPTHPPTRQLPALARTATRSRATARSTPSGPAPARRNPGKSQTEGKKLQLGLRGSGLGRGTWRAGGATRKGALLSTFWPSRCPVLLQSGPRKEVK